MSYWDQFQRISGPTEPVPQPIQQAVQQPNPQQKSIETPQQTNPEFWSQFQKIEAPETGIESFQRQAKGAITRGLGQLAGLTGDIESLGRSIIPGVEKETFFPTSAKIMEKRKELHPELEPRDRQEAVAQEILGDYILQPGGPLKKLAISAASTFAKEAAKDLGGGEKIQTGAKIITGILASRAGKPNVKDFIKKEYNEASNAIPKNASISGARAEKYLDQVKKNVNKGGHASWKDDVNKQINALEKSISGGKINVTSLDQAVKDINSQLLEKGIRGTQAEMWLTRIKKAAQHELKQYGKTNPKFMKHYASANAGFAGYKQSLIAQRMVDKFKEKGLLSGTLGLAAEAFYHPEYVVHTAGAIGAAYGVKKSGELIRRVFSNPTLANYYMKATAAAAKENAPQFIANLAKLDEGLRKFNQNSPNRQ